MGISIISAIFTAFSTTMPTSSWGLATMRMPSSGRDWKTLRVTSPVPGGMSTKRQSQFQRTSVQNCCTTPQMTGPRQTTGSVSFSSRRLVLITWMPVSLSQG